MISDHSAVSRSHQIGEHVFDFRDRVTKAWEKKLRLRDVPTRINSNQQAVAVGSENLVEFTFKIVNALVELVDMLNGPRQSQVCACVGFRVAGFAKSCDDGHLCRADLKEEQQQR